MIPQAVDQRTRNRLVKLGHACEPPELVRPKRGPCLYVQDRLADGTWLPRTFKAGGKTYRISYVDGCFYPFIFHA